MTAGVALSAVGAYFISRLADQGLANFFGEATCRHGTHPLAWLSIHILGPAPIMGGNSTGGSDKAIANDNRGLFFCARGPRRLIKDWNIQRWAMPRFIPRQYCLIATNNFLQKCSIPSILTVPVALITALVLPPIRIRMAQEDLEKMPVAPRMSDVAVCTDRWIPPWNLGTPGTIWNALHYKTPLRMFREPMRVITGIAQLAIAGAVAYYVYTRMPDYIVQQKTALIAGAVLGMI